MKNNNIIILHVFSDGLIFSGVADIYDSIPNLKNLYYFYSPDNNFKPRHLNDDRIKIIANFKEYVSYFSKPEIDIVLFHALPYNYYYLFDYIDDKKLVVWWAWGYDIYYSQGPYPPLIQMKEMYKPLTKEYMTNCNVSKQSAKFRQFISVLFAIGKRAARKLMEYFKASNRPHKSQEEILARIDMFYSPLDIEYDLMKEAQTSFVAKRIQHFGLGLNKEIPFVFKEKNGNVLINHSLTYTDNHLDVFDFLKDIEISNERKYIIPISYGINGFDGNPENLIKASTLDEKKTVWLTKVLPKKEYFELLDTVTHAVFGALRQQALGNIYWCINNGIKVYLFQDSILFKELKKLGFIVFSIENDLTDESLSVCLDYNDAKTNNETYKKLIMNNTPSTCRDLFLTAIMEKQKD